MQKAGNMMSVMLSDGYCWPLCALAEYWVSEMQ